MKKIWNYLKGHFRQDFDAASYGGIAVLLALSLSINYYFDFEDDYLEVMRGYPKFFAYFAFYSLSYFSSVLIYLFAKKRSGVLKRKEFWIKSLFGISVLSLDGSVFFLGQLVNSVFDPATQFWGYKVSVNAISFFTVFIPIVIFYFRYEKNDDNLYGLAPRKFDATPYFAMLLIMLPLLIGASFHESFLRQYPMYKTSGAHTHLGVSEWVTVVIYEIAYGSDFVTVEYLFRGFFVIAMAAVLGRGAVIPMAALYCFLHFGKPAGEAISSIFGGYVLGVVAYETKSIWGGIIVHMGIAWTMELVAFIQKSAS